MSARLRVRVTPRAARNEIVKRRAGVLQVRVTAPPEGGKANAAVCRLVARALKVPPSRVEVARGAGSRDKLLRIEGIEQAQAERLHEG
jgi:uncharacterized protein (TIGR00251 family)